MSNVFDQELREKLHEARRLRDDARSANDEDGAQAYAGRVALLLRIAEQHGVVVERCEAAVDVD
ncbi:hypothetical protein [Kitasatospora azatica]|uniref:hypothetical protein n=1 Tax=Kitasatospora azatica TaxID=58347 RepID=UPI00056C1AEA|nr:hypothetical protein [Kitasatospora azatica]